MDEFNLLRKKIIDLEQDNSLLKDTEKKLRATNQQLKVSEQQLKAKQEALMRTQRIAHVGSWEWDVASDTVSWSDELFRIFRLNPETGAVSYADHPKIYTPESMQRLDKAVKHTLECGEPYEMDLEIIRSDRTNAFCTARGFAQKDENGKIIQLYGSLQDITERKNSEEQLKTLNQQLQAGEQKLKAFNEKLIASEKQFRQLFENMEQGFALHEMIYDKYGKPKDYRFVLINNAFEKLTGINTADYIGKTVKQVLPATEQIWIDKYGKVAKTGKPIQVEHFSKEFGKYYNVTAYSPKKNYFATVFTDTTQDKLISKQLLEAKQKAEESDRLKSTFLANMSHEIRTPMNGILGFTDLLKEPKLSGAETQKYISIIESSGNRLLNTVNDLIDFSKIEAGQMKVSVSMVNINLLIEQLNNFFNTEAQKNGLQLFLDTSSSTKNSYVFSDKEKIYSILTNLIKNAIKYSQSGKIEFGYEKIGTDLQFFVKDTGIGISKEKLEVIFDRFIRVGNDEEFYGEGAGLGLSITKAYVEMLGGKIWVESEVGIGSNFYFTIPFETAENAASPKT